MLPGWQQVAARLITRAAVWYPRSGVVVLLDAPPLQACNHQVLHSLSVTVRRPAARVQDAGRLAWWQPWCFPVPRHWRRKGPVARISRRTLVHTEFKF